MNSDISPFLCAAVNLTQTMHSNCLTFTLFVSLSSILIIIIFVLSYSVLFFHFQYPLESLSLNRQRHHIIIYLVLHAYFTEFTTDGYIVCAMLSSKLSSHSFFFHFQYWLETIFTLHFSVLVRNYSTHLLTYYHVLILWINLSISILTFFSDVCMYVCVRVCMCMCVYVYNHVCMLCACGNSPCSLRHYYRKPIVGPGPLNTAFQQCLLDKWGGAEQ